ncbi:DUF2064 domain-containing protein [Knoellia sp. 3-2P3]|uniref:TIGR04282 family arsenosugar biosynthesis glycosyltransferase n=1 Tax=unclassified Knoellia TaxID=2618719 RepID=UPI0023DBF609|nr:DUF2064 domain-containing protein [Knoellia sp. 3-2P3]MDF2092265.1 DUF2064 domain-containing protein [Knoellia sp. 3-2P3]
MSVAVVVLAKAPVPGVAKTRLAAVVGDRRAADLAAAALLDTLELCAEVFPSGFRVAALDGHLAEASRRDELAATLHEWQVIDQTTGGLGERICHALHATHRLTGGPVVLVGMDTPHLQTGILAEVAESVAATGRPVLGPAADGGWWVLAIADPRHADGLADVPMSRPDTYARTHEAVCRVSRRVAPAPVMRDVDTVVDAAWAAAAAPRSRFARAWREGGAHQGWVSGTSARVGTEAAR